MPLNLAAFIIQLHLAIHCNIVSNYDCNGG